MVVGEEDGNSELLEEAWLSDVDSDVDGNSESGDGLAENLQRGHAIEETKSIVGQHLQLRLEALRSEEESWGEMAEVPPRLVLLTLAGRLDSGGNARPSRTSFMFDRFDPLLFDFPLLPPELVPHRSDGTAERVSEELVKVTSDLLLEEPFASFLFGGSRVILTAGLLSVTSAPTPHTRTRTEVLIFIPGWQRRLCSLCQKSSEMASRGAAVVSASDYATRIARCLSTNDDKLSHAV